MVRLRVFNLQLKEYRMFSSYRVLYFGFYSSSLSLLSLSGILSWKQHMLCNVVRVAVCLPFIGVSLEVYSI